MIDTKDEELCHAALIATPDDVYRRSQLGHELAKPRSPHLRAKPQHGTPGAVELDCEKEPPLPLGGAGRRAACCDARWSSVRLPMLRPLLWLSDFIDPPAEKNRCVAGRRANRNATTHSLSNLSHGGPIFGYATRSGTAAVYETLGDLGNAR